MCISFDLFFCTYLANTSGFLSQDYYGIESGKRIFCSCLLRERISSLFKSKRDRERENEREIDKR